MFVRVTQLAKAQPGYEPRQWTPDHSLHLWSRSHAACHGSYYDEKNVARLALTPKVHTDITFFSLLKAYER